MLTNIFGLLLCVFLAESIKYKYEYVPSVEGYFKLHKVPASWQEARFRCHLEGGYLASPENKQVAGEMLIIMKEKQDIPLIYTGIHATYSKGDYTSVTGTPLSELDVAWVYDKPNNLDDDQDCIIMYSSGALSSEKCSVEHPFLCFKLPNKLHIHACSHMYGDSDYIPHNETGSCYKFHKEGRSWPAAFRVCQAEDAYLAIINSEEESHVLKELFAQNPPHTIPGGFHKDAASIGFTKWDEDQEWFTIHGQSLAEAGFSTFNAGEPNNIGDNESCGSVWRTGLLNDHNCERKLPFICEKSIASGENLQEIHN